MFKKLAIIAICSLVIVACAQSPTGRRQIMLFNDAELSKMGEQTFEEMKAQVPISTNARTNTYVQCVANALLKVTPQEFMGNTWEVVVFDSTDINAFALPGGKIGVYTGLLNVAKNADQLAAVVGHEIAHVMAGHSNERLSTDQFLQTALTIGDTALKAYDVKYQSELMAALGLGAQVGVTLPFSRTHETEADILGLELMAKAGFNPSQSVDLWQNMAAASANGSPEILSTHPLPTTRITNLQAKMPEMTAIYNTRKASASLPNCKP